MKSALSCPQIDLPTFVEYQPTSNAVMLRLLDLAISSNVSISTCFILAKNGTRLGYIADQDALCSESAGCAHYSVFPDLSVEIGDEQLVSLEATKVQCQAAAILLTPNFRPTN